MRATDLINLMVAARPLLQGAVLPRAMPKLLLVILLSVIAGILGSAIILGLFYAFYSWLLTQEISSMHGLLITIGIAGLALLICLLVLKCKLAQLKKAALPSPDGITKVISAFLDGLSTSAKPRE